MLGKNRSRIQPQAKVTVAPQLVAGVTYKQASAYVRESVLPAAAVSWVAVHGSLRELVKLRAHARITDSPWPFTWRAFSDVAQSADAMAWSMIRGQLDVVQATEVVVMQFTKGLVDTVSSSESITLQVSSGMYETVNTQSTVSFKQGKGFADQVQQKELLGLSITKAWSEEVSVEDQHAFRISKPISDTLYVAGSFNTRFTKGLLDSVNSKESGCAAMNDYFAEDYVLPGYAGRIITFK